MLTVKQIEAAKPKEKPYRLTPVTLETAPSSASNGVIDGNATLCDWRIRNSASVSAGEPTVAAAGLVTETQPRVGVLISVIVPASAATAPLTEHFAVAITVPSTPTTTEAGKRHITLLLSFTLPLMMVVPAVPVRSKSTVEFVAPLTGHEWLLSQKNQPEGQPHQAPPERQF